MTFYALLAALLGLCVVLVQWVAEMDRNDTRARRNLRRMRRERLDLNPAMRRRT